MPWTYLQSETPDSPTGEMWTVGRHDPAGTWFAESDWGSAREAADRADFLTMKDDDLSSFEVELARHEAENPIPPLPPELTTL